MAHKSVIGKDMLQMLMFSLYPEPETIYREYLQNASDSIQEAKRSGLLEEEEGHISIDINEAKRQIIIKDNGIGVQASNAESILKDIAVSPKKGKSYVAGCYGIGRLVGAGYCNKLLFRTSYKGETTISELEIDVQKIRECLDDEKNTKTATEVLDFAARFSKKEEAAEKHYFEVILNDILPEYADNLLNEDRIKNYLMQVAPVDYKAEFKSTLVEPSLETTELNIKDEVSDYVRNLNVVKISLNNIVDIRKKYTYKIEGLDDDIDTLRYFVLKNKKFGTLAWGWYAVTAFTFRIPDKDPKTNELVLTRGLRLRLKNIQIGDANFFDGTSYFKQPRSNKYFNGEIHVVNENIKPTTDRSDLAPSKETLELKKMLADFFNNEMQGVYQNANKAKTTVNELVKIVQENSELKEKEEKGILSESEKSKLENISARLDKVNKDIQKYITKKEPSNIGESKMLDLYKKRLDDVGEKVKKGATAELTIQGSNSKSSLIQNKQDIFEELASKYSDAQMVVIKRIFNIIDTNFYTDAYKTITKVIKAKILSELKK